MALPPCRHAGLRLQGARRRLLRVPGVPCDSERPETQKALRLGAPSDTEWLATRMGC